MSNKLSLGKDKIKILLTENIHAKAVEAFNNAGYTSVEYLTYSPSEEELLRIIPEYHIIGIRSNTKLPANVLEKAKKLLTIGSFCIGTDGVDKEAAKKLGIPAFNAPFSNTRSVAELIIAYAVVLMRGIPEKSYKVHNGIWEKSAKDSYEVRGKNLGIIGYGHIGTQVSVLAESLGMNVFFHDIESKLVIGNAKEMDSLKALLEVSDVVTLHVPDTKETRNLMSYAEIAAMKKGAKLINLSRGKVVDIDALVKGLEDGQIGGAAIDVYPKEPKSKDEEFISPLRKFQNVILTPHIGGSTMEAQENIGKEVAHKLIKYSDNGSTLTSVNFTEVTLPTHEGKSRILHIHKNIPGVMAGINDVFALHKVNIAGQYLQTDPDIGYVIIDTDSKISEEAIKQLRAVNGTIRVRLLY